MSSYFLINFTLSSYLFFYFCLVHERAIGAVDIFEVINGFVAVVSRADNLRMFVADGQIIDLHLVIAGSAKSKCRPGNIKLVGDYAFDGLDNHCHKCSLYKAGQFVPVVLI